MINNFRFLLLLALTATGQALAGPVNINTADAATLSRELKGIGAAKAQAIVEFRQKNGGFRTIDELSMVKGIGQRLIEQNRADLRIEKPGTAPAAARPGAPVRPAPAVRK
jgi:competence protein ComEA